MISSERSSSHVARWRKCPTYLLYSFDWHVLFFFKQKKTKKNTFSKISGNNIKTTVIPTMAPIRWAASAPLLPPLRHLTRSIVQSNSERQWSANGSAGSTSQFASWVKTPRLYRSGSTCLGDHWSPSCSGATWLEEKAFLKHNPLTPANSYWLRYQR